MNSILVDTNLFLLLVVGGVNRNYITSHKRTRIFTPEDFDLLMANLSSFQTIWITSHCLAEVSNLLKQTDSRKQNELLMGLTQVCDSVKESHINKNVVFADNHYLKLGIADTGFLQKSKRVSCSLTVDHDLHLSLLNLGRKVINFNHLRMDSLLS